jgi:hypothetical protein
MIHKIEEKRSIISNIVSILPVYYIKILIHIISVYEESRNTDNPTMDREFKLGDVEREIIFGR